MVNAFGGRGGDAYNEELLKELMAILSKSSRRFDDDDAAPRAEVPRELADVALTTVRPSTASTASFAIAVDANTADTGAKEEIIAVSNELIAEYKSDSDDSRDVCSHNNMDSNTVFAKPNTFQGKNGGTPKTPSCWLNQWLFQTNLTVLMERRMIMAVAMILIIK